MADPRLGEALRLFNACEWYACHDKLEELWHETSGPWRAPLQGILQLAVAQLHLERGNRRGATILIGEGLGRLAHAPGQALGMDFDGLRSWARSFLQSLQQDGPLPYMPAPRLGPAEAGQ